MAQSTAQPALDIPSLNEELSSLSPQKIVAKALSLYDNIAISFSGAEDVVLIDIAHRLKKDIQVFSLDTGRLHSETYQFIEKVRKHYGIAIDILSPDAAQLEAFVKAKGLFSFYEDGHKECCGIRKVAPLRRKLSSLDAWITGQRKDQSPSTRSDVPIVQVDGAFSSGDRELIKFNPLSNWSSAQVWTYIRAYEVPYNPLHERGFISIGCEPCTKAVLPNQHEREGRWWWEDATKKECGLHAVNPTES
ncbi:MAG: phosphoadenylyl-sulfate reductase [Leptolyngbya sp. UWPOB_LEPTO1]|uniref:phosphoadenylyl-sulfate reductase n=1 Tax=Leptolyngbya sp. UWPOB_LEPTO1 TaxID=2815653 RepID=UPI001AC58DD6|nr:phosphoadenylyl-sulfate reductase [Leptolyngbya sp. UWPOB_LEPTO1]MBN8560808.1 phosphoadenylyl-sulfate reductase [Leptolyngbya sp. UWPOB_LEPTO1]